MLELIGIVTQSTAGKLIECILYISLLAPHTIVTIIIITQYLAVAYSASLCASVLCSGSTDDFSVDVVSPAGLLRIFTYRGLPNSYVSYTGEP